MFELIKGMWVIDNMLICFCGEFMIELYRER